MRYIIFLFILIITYSAIAQQKNLPSPGAAKGIVRDTVHNYVLSSATASVYKHDDHSLISFQLTNSNGEFEFKNLPLEISLSLEVSFIGYSPIRKEFKISSKNSSLDLKTIILSPAAIELNEVVVSIPPISMNGDTLEFNANAFKLDTNAVVEDFLRKIPNITLWADGSITVNGREVKSLLVNGKQFFGSDAKIATQNIPKNAIDKVQAYTVQKDSSNPLDSILELNVKLKKGKDRGYFGKISAGAGSNKRYEADGSLNFFTSQLQLSLVGASNNLNKTFENVSTLISNSSFKGIGTSIIYQPNFESNDLVSSNVGGFSGIFDFHKSPNPERVKKLSLDYFIKNKELENYSDLSVSSTLRSNETTLENRSSKNNVSGTDHILNARYEWIKQDNSIIFTQSVKNLSRNTTYHSSVNTQDNQGNLTSLGNEEKSETTDEKSVALSAFIRKNLQSREKIQRLGILSALYSLDVNESNSVSFNNNSFISYINPLSSRDFNRKYNIRDDVTRQRFTVEIKEISIRFLRLNLSVFNDLKFKTNRENSVVHDLSLGDYLFNNYLSNNLITNTIDETPGVTVSKTFVSSLADRFTKKLSMNAGIKQAVVFQNSKSEKSFQNFNNSYSRFTPELTIIYNDKQYGLFNRTFSVKFTNEITIPTIDQLAPLVDSINLYNIQKGNPNLRESLTRNLSFQFSHEKQNTKNTFGYNLNLNIGLIENRISDSTFVNADNRRVVYFINLSGARYFNIYGEIRKAIKLHNSELQFKLTSKLQLSETPSFLNETLVLSDNLNLTNDLGILYNNQGRFAIEYKLSFFKYNSKQKVFNNNFSGRNISNMISSSYNLTKRFAMSSNLSFKQSGYGDNNDINFTIWNAYAAYRFLKGNNGEIKFSALDILKQNNNVVNFVDGNNFTYGTQSVLRQYFMFTLSYFPRKFGKN